MTKIEQLKTTIANLEMDLRLSRACTAEYRELIDSLCEDNEAFKSDLEASHDLISTHHGHYVAWDEIVEACGNGCYSESPLELIADIINERDEAKRELASFTEQGMREAT